MPRLNKNLQKRMASVLPSTKHQTGLRLRAEALSFRIEGFETLNLNPIPKS